MQDILTRYLREEAMQEIITGKMRESKDSGVTWAALERIEAYLASSPIVLFMKGSPDFPQCGMQA